jgi:hypothetical protein
MRKRIIFAKYKDPLGDNAYKFIGIFKRPESDENDDGTRHYKRIEEECSLLK